MRNMTCFVATHPTMFDISITEAKARLAELVKQAECGQPVRITRRGRAVAVLVPVADHDRLQIDRAGLLAYSAKWRNEAVAAGVPLASPDDWAALRDESERPAPDLA
jgi:prevent-host-death family protein